MVTGFVVNSMSLSPVFVDVGVHKLNDVVSDGRSKDGGHGDAVYDLVLVVFGIDTNYWSGGHLYIYDT